MKTRTVDVGRVDLHLTLRPLRHGPLDPTIAFGPGGVLRATRTPLGPCTLRLRPVAGRVEATGWGPGADWALDRVPQLIGGDDTAGAFRPRDLVMRELQRATAGLRMCRSGSVFESLLPTIIEQKVTSREAHRSYSKLVLALGEDAPGPGGLKLPPQPEELLARPYYDFHAFGIEKRRVAIVKTAGARASRLQEICDATPESLESALLSLEGIGRWTAGHLMQAVVGDPDAVIVGDYHMPHTVSWVLAGEARGDDRRMLELVDPYRGQRGRAIRMIMISGRRPPAFGSKRPLRRIERI